MANYTMDIVAQKGRYMSEASLVVLQWALRGSERAWCESTSMLRDLIRL